MKIILRTLALAIIATGIVACAALQLATPALPPPVAATVDKAAEKVRIGAEYVFEGFRTAWIPMLAAYRSQPKCSDGGPTLCWSPGLYAKLYRATDVATACMVASTAPGVPIAELQLCVSKVEGAKVVFVQSGLIPKGVP